MKSYNFYSLRSKKEISVSSTLKSFFLQWQFRVWQAKGNPQFDVFENFHLVVYFANYQTLEMHIVATLYKIYLTKKIKGIHTFTEKQQWGSIILETSSSYANNI